MKKEKFAMVTLLMAIIFAAGAFVFSACDTDLIDFEEADIEFSTYDHLIPSSLEETQGMPYIVLKSTVQKEEYIELIKEEHIAEQNYSQENWESYYRPAIESILNKYNETFFTKYNLVMFLFWRQASTNYKIKKMSVKNNELYIKMDLVCSPFGYQLLGAASSYMFVPLEKKDFDGDKVTIEKCVTWW